MLGKCPVAKLTQSRISYVPSLTGLQHRDEDDDDNDDDDDDDDDAG